MESCFENGIIFRAAIENGWIFDKTKETLMEIFFLKGIWPYTPVSIVRLVHDSSQFTSSTTTL